jgi:hypothetical protein
VFFVIIKRDIIVKISVKISLSTVHKRKRQLLRLRFVILLSLVYDSPHSYHHRTFARFLLMDYSRLHSFETRMQSEHQQKEAQLL